MKEITLDDWQRKVLETKGNICLRSGRQVGKSTVISIKAAEFAVNNPNKTVVIIASVERQAIHLFLKVQNYLHDNYKKLIKKRMTLSFAELKNGAKIHCLPAGDTGVGVRGFTVDLLIADEAAFIKEGVWEAVTPMLAITRGSTILLSTPKGKVGYFYDCFEDPDYTSFHVSAEDCPRKNQAFLDHEKKRMTRLQYAQEYLGEFIEELRQFFHTDLIQACRKLKRREKILPNRDYYLGVDVARMGEDDSTFEVLDCTNLEKIEQVESIVTEKTYITDTVQQIIAMNTQYDFKKEFIDSGGMGVGVVDQLRLEDEHKRKVVEINNASREIDYRFAEHPRSKTLLKEELYHNLRRLMERGEIELLDDDEIDLSLRSVQAEYTDDGRLKIFGNNTHIVEGLIRAAWAAKSKSLNPMII